MGKNRRNSHKRNRAAQQARAQGDIRTDPASTSLQDQRAIEFFSTPGSATRSGRSMTENLAYNYSAWYRGLTLIAQTMAIMPCKIYRRIDGGGREEIVDHPANNIVNFSPDGEMTSFQFFETGTSHVITRGNSVSEIVRNNRGQAAKAHLLNPKTVSQSRSN